MRSKNPKSEINIEVMNHAWKYFEIHANQRISLFRYFIVILSLYITGSGYLFVRFECTTSLEEYGLIAFSLIFIFLTVIFWLLDSRNRELIHLAEESLNQSERDMKLENAHKIFIREREVSSCTVRHTCCFRMIFIGAIICATFILCYSFCHSCLPIDKCPTLERDVNKSIDSKNIKETSGAAQKM